MGKFSNFYTGGDNSDNNESNNGFSRVRNTSTNRPQYNSREERVWKVDFTNCSTKEDFEKYIRRYKKYTANPYLEKAALRLKELYADEEKSKKKERQARSRKRHNSTTQNKTNNSSLSSLYAFRKVAIWLIILSGVGIYSYNEYKKDSYEQMSVPINQDNISKNEPSSQQENSCPVSQPTDDSNQKAKEIQEPQKVYLPCTQCSNGSCMVCGGSGQVYSVFDGNDIVSGRLTDCGACNGSGRCVFCDGSGLVEDFSF